MIIKDVNGLYIIKRSNFTDDVMLAVNHYCAKSLASNCIYK